MRRNVALILVVLMAATSISCASMNRAQKGAIIGAAAGAAGGAAIGKASGNTAMGAILGAAIGGTAGAYIGSYMDRQAAEIEKDLEGATVTRVGEGIKITFDSGILFDINKATLKPVAQSNLTKLAVILNKYDDTEVLLEGHTDATGSDEWNLELSRLRSQSASNHLTGQNVMAGRFIVMGYGEAQPVSTNETADGRAQNRRVEVAIYANDKLKKVAKNKVEG